ncbi:MAG: hypothetical protein ACOYOP_06825 [Microthrixaceae bacterium]
MAAAVAAGWVLLPVVAPAQDAAPAPTQPVVAALIPGEVTPAALEVIRTLANAEVPTDVQYLGSSSAEARRGLVAGETDLAVSGVGFSDAEIAALKDAGKGLISAPIQAVGLQVFGNRDTFRYQAKGCRDNVDPDTGEPIDLNLDCTVRSYEGTTIRLDPDLLEQIFIERNDGANVWNSAKFADLMAPLLPPPTAAAPKGWEFVSTIETPIPVVRSDGDAFNQYLDSYIDRTRGQQRRAYLPSLAGVRPDLTPSEEWPNPQVNTRQGMDNVVSQVRERINPASSSLPIGGVWAATSPYYVGESFLLNEAKPPSARVPLFRVEVLNGAGEWVTATPATVTTAVEAGKGTPVTGATDSVPGAYPITWVNRAYLPQSGLTAAEVNGAAAFIRVQVTQGRAGAAKLGDGQITADMQKEALAAANSAVESNCAAAKGTVLTSSDGAPYVPKGVLPSGSYKYCQAAPPAPTAVPEAVAGAESAPADLATDPGLLDSGVTDSSGFSELSPVTDAAVSGELTSGATASVAGARTGKSAATVTTAAVGARMPLGIPGQSLAPLDRLVTLGMGALIFLGMRHLYLRRAGSF